MDGTTTRARRRSWLPLAAVLLLPLAGCYAHTVHTGSGAPRGPVVYEEWEHFWIVGLIGHERIDVREICRSGDATIRVEQSFLNGLVSAVTSGIYSPLTTKVRCRDGRRSRLELSDGEVERLVNDPDFRAWLEEAER